MTTQLFIGRRTSSMSRDAEGHRVYKIKHLIKADKSDGPANVLQTPGLPLPGSAWIIDNDVDLWAWCRWDATVQIHQEKEGDPTNWWTVEQTFSSKPPDLKKCKDVQVEDPLLEPAKVSGSFVRYQEEATHDGFGVPIENSAHEPIHGPKVEFDANRPQIKIEQNVALLNLGLLSFFVDRVNAFPLWGLPPRTIKLSNLSWERKFLGQCHVYYTRNLEFDIRYDGFDRDLLDEGSKVLSGHWDKATGLWVLDNVGGLGKPRAPTLEEVDTVDTLPIATYAYKITALRDTNETLPSPEVSITTKQPNGVFINWSKVTGATSYNIYGRIPGAVAHITNVTDNFYVDNGTEDYDPDIGPPTVDGTKIPPDPDNPTHFIRYKDKNNENTRVVLDGHGRPFVPDTEKITDCEACDEAPKVFRANGFDSGEVIITNDGGGCTWSGMDGSTEVTLAYDASGTEIGVGEWTLTRGEAEGTLSAALFNCGSGGLFYLSEEISETSTQVTPVTITSGSQPGSIHVQYYDEADFLLLGIPLDF